MEAEITVEFLFVLVILHVHDPDLLQVPGSGAELNEVFVEAVASCFDVLILTAVHVVITNILMVDLCSRSFSFNNAQIWVVGLNNIERRTWILNIRRVWRKLFLFGCVIFDWIFLSQA